MYSDRFTHRPSRPWPRAQRFWGRRAILSYDYSILTKNLFAKLRRGITSQFTLKREEMTLIRTVTTRQYCASERDAGRRDYEKNEKEENGA